MLTIGGMNPQYAWATVGRLFITSIHARPTVEMIDLLAVEGVAHHRRVAEKTASMTLVSSRIPLPDDAARRRSERAMSESAAHALCTATVLEGEGFWAGAARAAMASMILLSKSPVPHKIFADPAGACGWLGPQLALSDGEVRALVDAIAAMRVQHVAMKA